MISEKLRGVLTASITPVAENGALLHEYDREGFCALSKEEGYDPHRTR